MMGSYHPKHNSNTMEPMLLRSSCCLLGHRALCKRNSQQCCPLHSGHPATIDHLTKEPSQLLMLHLTSAN